MSKTSDSKYLKRLNRKKIFKLIVDQEGITRAQISKQLKINKATVSLQVQTLIDEGLVLENKSVEKNIGRTPIQLRINPSGGYAVGIDIDVEKITFLFSDLTGEMVEKRIVSMKTNSFDITANALKENILNMFDSLPKTRYDIIGIGVGVHSTVTKDGVVGYDINFRWEDINFKAYLREFFKVPVHIFNNINLSAYAEKTMHPDISTMLYISVSSGIGLGTYIDGKLFTGVDGFAGEIGHYIVEQDGIPCPCGNNGCIERYISDTALMNRLAEVESGIVDLESLDEIISTNPDAKKIIVEAQSKLEILILNLISIFNPEVVSIGSKYLLNNDDFIGRINSKLRLNPKQSCLVTIPHYNELSTVIGGVLYCVNDFICNEEISMESNI